MEESRLKECQLVLPALYFMSVSKNRGFITTTDLKKKLYSVVKPTGLDGQKVLLNRNDTPFDQKVRNLKSHHTFERKGLAKEETGGFRITQAGKDLVDENWALITQMVGNTTFNETDLLESSEFVVRGNRKRKLVLLDDLVSEGGPVQKTVSAYKRSSKLRNSAIEHFTHCGIIKCDCCGFEFKSFYGAKYGVSCIEIHHLKPLFAYEGKKLTVTIEEALQNLLPVCPNCHRVIHKKHILPEQIPTFKQYIASRK